MIAPVVRYMILCDNWTVDPANPTRVSIHGLLTNIHAIDEEPYPLLFEEMCVFLVLTEGYGTGRIQIVCVFEETGEKVFETPYRDVVFSQDPLGVLGVPFRIKDCMFPRPGLYSIQFLFDNLVIQERPLRLR